MSLRDNSKISRTINAQKFLDREKALKERKNKIEEFMLFDIDKNNASPNKENQRLI